MHSGIGGSPWPILVWGMSITHQQFDSFVWCPDDRCTVVWEPQWQRNRRLTYIRTNKKLLTKKSPGFSHDLYSPRRAQREEISGYQTPHLRVEVASLARSRRHVAAKQIGEKSSLANEADVRQEPSPYHQSQTSLQLGLMPSPKQLFDIHQTKLEVADKDKAPIRRRRCAKIGGQEGEDWGRRHRGRRLHHSKARLKK